MIDKLLIIESIFGENSYIMFSISDHKTSTMLCCGYNSLPTMSSADFFRYQLFRQILSGIPSECQRVWIQIRPDVLLGLIWVQTVCKGYQETTLVGKEFGHRGIA